MTEVRNGERALEERPEITEALRTLEKSWDKKKKAKEKTGGPAEGKRAKGGEGGMITNNEKDYAWSRDLWLLERGDFVRGNRLIFNRSGLSSMLLMRGGKNLLRVLGGRGKKRRKKE